MKFGQNPSRDVIERNCGKRGTNDTLSSQNVKY
jgi:hypothetical protein